MLNVKKPNSSICKLFIFLTILIIGGGSIFTFTAGITSCKSPFGFGEIIDWEPPVLTLDPGPNPRYVRLGTKLSGTVVDNVGVTRVLLREAGTGKELFQAELNGEKWEIILNFDETQNGEKLAVEVVAYDKAGNSGEASIRSVTLIIDIRPPIIEDIWIARTSMKQAYLETYEVLKELETTDPRGEDSANANSYQNGWFNISAKVSEEETRVEVVSLNIYDVGEEGEETLLLTIGRTSDSTTFTPRWLVKEEEIIEAGNILLPDYKTNYNNGKRNYYRVSVVAYDRSDNASENSVIIEDQQYFCMWKEGDTPKGLLELTDTVLTRGTPIPVKFFDDDSLDWAYTDLLTKNQWNAVSGQTDDAKINYLKEQLRTGKSVSNWKKDKHGVDEAIRELIEGKSLDEKPVFVQTGINESDYGEYVLFALAADKKLEPHNTEDLSLNIWKGRVWRIYVIDENAPLIVFDTVNTSDSDYNADNHPGGSKLESIVQARTGNSPEENTFPRLTDGRYFEINGYTLRENRSKENGVIIFRMAWIPYGMGDGHPDDYIKAVQDALKEGKGYPEGVQYWDLSSGLVDGTDEIIGTTQSPFRKQVFRKKFDILGETTDPVTSWKDFYYNGKFENETKLFVFYVVDNMQQEVYRTLRLLGMKNPPDLAIFDISGLSNAAMENLKPPDLSVYDLPANSGNNNGVIDSSERANYEKALLSYQQGAYSIINTAAKAAQNIDLYRTIPFQTYTRGTILKYWIKAEKPAGGDIEVKTITMQDITNEGQSPSVGYYGSSDRSLSYTEMLPEVSQRVFLFTAEDLLGNKAQIQRTVAVTSTAFLLDINTPSESGTYGAGQKITIRARFSGQIKWSNNNSVDNDSPKPQLNVRYRLNNQDVIQSIETITPENVSTLFLDFEFTIPVEAGGVLQTMHGGLTGIPAGGNPTTEINRPIRLNGAVIYDALKEGEHSFTPGNTSQSSSMPNWTTNKSSLQEAKTITLDGVSPVINSLTVSGKTPISSDPSAPAWYLFKVGDKVSFTITANEPIKTSGSTLPVLQFKIRPLTGTTAPDTYSALWEKAPSNNTMVFGIPVTNVNVDGEIVEISLNTASGTITDDAGNEIASASSTIAISNDIKAFIDRTPPAAPNTELIINGANTWNTNTTGYYNLSPRLIIPDEDYIAEPWGVIKQYSLNDGQTWIDYPNPQSPFTVHEGGMLFISNGEWKLKTRYKDFAGNEGLEKSKNINVNNEFPRLLAVSAGEPNGYYINGDTLTFKLDFSNTVRVTNQSSVSITIRDINDPGGANRNVTLNTVTPQNGSFGRTVNFTWPLTGNWEMPSGLYVSAVNLAGLVDEYGTIGGSSTGATTSTIITIRKSSTDSTTYTTGNLNAAGIKVDTIVPYISSRNPANAGLMGAGNETITITFNENVMIGSGTITVKPYGDYAIPPVFENDGKYDDAGRWIAGFYDVYNSGLTADQRNYLTQGATSSDYDTLNTTNPSMSRLRLNERTSQNYGPYIKTAHGLIPGSGYTGDYNNTTPGANGPNPVSGHMVPDTATKWVLDYQYNINDATAGSAVSNIRAALNAAEYRWQKFEVSSSNVRINGAAVIITLNEPLLDGLQWVLEYSAGTFTDMAGNTAPAMSGYWFWSRGVQVPVIRVDRKSYDARTSNWRTSTTYNAPANGTGWGINDFNTVNFKVESETPGAAIYGGTIQGTPNTSSATIQWTGATGGRSWNTVINDVNPVNGDWVQPNLIYRAGRANNASNAVTYTVLENGYTVTRQQTYSPNNPWWDTRRPYQGFRSYNRDALVGDITGFTVNYGSTFTTRSFTYTALEARKDYVIATARVTNGGEQFTSARGYEGVFRSVVALNQYNLVANQVANNGGTGATSNGENVEYIQDNSPMQVTGSNVKNGMPSIAGFPVRDAEDTDFRYVKIYYEDTDKHFYWVSTEVVCQWYHIAKGVGYQSTGEVNNYLTAGYGDLTYSFNQR